MKRSYIYVIVVLLTITLVSADYIIGKDLQNIMPLDVTYHNLDGDYVKEAGVVGNITITNEQNTNQELTYKYTIKINGLAGAYRCKFNDEEKYLIFAANGEADFELKANKSVTIYDVPVDLTYTIRQQTESQDFTLTTNNQNTNVATGETSDNSTITFKNVSTKVTKEPKKETNKETKKDSKVKKKDIPNTGEREIRLTLVLIVSLLIIVCFKIMKVKRFE